MNSRLGILKILAAQFPITVIAFPEISGLTMNDLCVQPVFTSEVLFLWSNLPRHLIWLAVSKYQAKCECRNRYWCRCLLVPLTARMSGVECSGVQTYPGVRLQLLLTVPGGLRFTVTTVTDIYWYLWITVITVNWTTDISVTDIYWYFDFTDIVLILIFST